jgi:hypothetical protein
MAETEIRLEIFKIAKDLLVDEHYTKESKKLECFYPTFQQIKELAQQIENYVR